MSLVGTTVGAYRVLAPIGEGGMGTVYLAEHTLLGRKAAIKVLRPSLSAEADVVERFFNEARAVTRITDPGIVQIFDFGHHTDRSAFIVMELLEGEPLDRRLDRLGGLSLTDTLRFMRLVCGSLAVAHAHGIVHRDLKPENLFIVRDSAVPGGERIKILDFGIAKLSGDQPSSFKTRTGVLLGTPAYMSPEQCRGQGHVDHRADIYTIGCVMFAMVTGRPPFGAAGLGELLAAHLLEPPPLASSLVAGLPGVVDQILLRCLAKSPEERFPSMLELGEAIGRADHELQSTAGSAPTAMPAAPDPRPRPAPRAPIAARPSPTTLVSASGQSGALATASQPGRRRWIAGVFAAAVAIAGTVMIAQRGGGDASRPEPGSGRREPAEPPSAAAQPAPTSDAATGGDDAGRAMIIVQDAGLADAPVDAAPIDAAVREPHRPSAAGSGPRPRTTRGDHASSTGSAAPLRVDRTD